MVMLTILTLFILINVLTPAIAGAQPLEHLEIDLAGVEWVKLPRFPGDIGTIKVVLYVEKTYVDVTIRVEPKCDFIHPLNEKHFAIVNTRHVEAILNIRIDRLGDKCPMNVIFDPKYRLELIYIKEEPYYLPTVLDVPTYPDLKLVVNGSAILGLPSKLTIRLMVPKGVTGRLSLSGEGLVVLRPTHPIDVSGNKTIEVLALPNSLSATLIAELSTRDMLGNPVKIIRRVSVSVSDNPGPEVFTQPTRLVKDSENLVKILVRLPIDAEGFAKVDVDGGVLISGDRFSIVNGVGVGEIRLVPIRQMVSIRIRISANVDGYWVSMTKNVELPASSVPGNVVLKVEPDRLVMDAENSVNITIRAPGRFVAELYISGAASNAQIPLIIRGVDEASARLRLTPTSKVVEIRAIVRYGNNEEEVRSVIPVVTGDILLIVPRTKVLEAGGVRTLIVSVVNTGDVAIRRATIVLSPGEGIISPTYTLVVRDLKPLESRDIPVNVTVPITTSGPISMTYTVTYTTELGSVARTRGQFFVDVVQVPKLEITRISIAPREPRARKGFFISVTLTNTGFVQALGVLVRVKLPNNRIYANTPVNFVGRLEPQESKTVPISLIAWRPGNYNITIVIEYLDNRGVSHVLAKTINVSVRPGEEIEAGIASMPRGMSPGESSSKGIDYTVVTVALIIATAMIVAAFVVSRRRNV